MKKVYLKPLHISMSVKNLDESIKWYEKHLNFELVFSMYLAQHHAKLAFMRHGDFEIEMFEHDESKPIPPERLDPHEDQKTQGTKHIAFLVEDVDEIAERLKGEGVEIAIGPKFMENKELGVKERICFIRDLNGIAIEFIQRGF
ncbi:MAG: VOC family protein [Tepidanaerobacteraceae bacterium]|jgi:methylmalonyl-CoA/ethylmalonyl-CoA epimerase